MELCSNRALTEQYTLANHAEGGMGLCSAMKNKHWPSKEKLLNINTKNKCTKWTYDSGFNKFTK